MTAEALSGEITKTGKSGKQYIFSFGWACLYNMEQVFGPGLREMKNQESFIAQTATVLLCGLKAKASNEIKPDLSQLEIYQLMDEFDEPTTKELYQAAEHALGFIGRVLGANSEPDVKTLTAKALENQSQPTTTVS